MNINEPIIKEKYIVYSKPDMKRNKSPEISNKNLINIREEITKKEKKGKNENINIKINSGNQIINVNAINVNIDTGEKEHFEPVIYDKGGWNQPHVLYWLDAKLPYEEYKIDK